MSAGTYLVTLSREEIVLLDGKVSPGVQAEVNKAKREASFGFSLPLLGEVLQKSEAEGRLTWTFKQIRSCPYCTKKWAYHKHTRSGRYHRKGDPSDKPIHYFGVAFNEGFITFQGSGDICKECFAEKRIVETLIDYILDQDLKIEIQKNNYKPTRYIRDNIQACFGCNAEIQESKMGRENVLMGGGTYPARCPNCGATARFLGSSHKTTGKFVMIPAEPGPGGSKEKENGR